MLFKTFWIKKKEIKSDQVWWSNNFWVFFYQMVLQSFSSLCSIQKLTCVVGWWCIVYIVNQCKRQNRLLGCIQVEGNLATVDLNATSAVLKAAPLHTREQTYLQACGIWDIMWCLVCTVINCCYKKKTNWTQPPVLACIELHLLGICSFDLI